jgi:hypothetical protein
MSHERHERHEHHEHHERQHHDLDKERREQLEKLRHTAETSQENSKERAEAAREVINRPEPEPKPEPGPAPESHAPRVHIPYIDHQVNFKETMQSVQRRLSPVSRQFSRFIHTPAVEKTSEALEKTIARPSVSAGTTITAMVVGSLFYFTAYHFGYMLSGSELLFSFVVGALIGIVLETLLRPLFRR